MSRFQENLSDRYQNRRRRIKSARRTAVLLGLDLLESRQLLAFVGSAPPTWHPTSTDPLDVHTGPLANAGPQIISAYQEYLRFVSVGGKPLDQFQSSDSMLMTRNGLLGVSVSVYGDSAAMAQALSDPSGIGMAVTATNSEYGLIEGYVSPANLVNLARFNTSLAGQAAGVVSYGPMIKPLTAGSSVQAVNAFKLPQALQQFPGLTGSGVTLGILSDSISLYAGGLNDSISANAAPPLNRIQVLEDGPYGEDEGRAMLEVAYDIAPGANFAFHTAFNGALNFAQGIKDLSSAGAQVIVDDVSYFYEPAFQPGPIEAAVSNVVKTQNRVYYSSAANSADQGYLSSFRPVTATVGGISGTWMNFNPNGGTLTQLPVTVNYGGYVNFQFDQPFYKTNGVTSQVDVYFLDSTGKIVASGTADNIATQTPQQAINLYGLDGQTLYMAVNVSKGPAPDHIFAAKWGGDLNFSHQFGNAGGTSYSTTTGHNAAVDGIGVGAVDVRSIPPYSVTQPIPSESYSSVGPRIVSFDAQGNPLAGGSQVLQRPQISAPDGIQTTFFIQGYYVGNESQPSFFGTSCAAPDAAALAVLMRQLAPGASQKEILDAMVASTISINGKPAGTGNWDSVGGAGLIQAPIAFAEIAPPQATNLTAVINQGPTVTLSWTSLSAKAISFTIKRLIEGVYTTIGTVNAPITTFTDINVLPGGQYTYIVVANTSQGPAQPSTAVTVNIPALPATPNDLQVLGVSTTWVLLGWSAVAPPVDGYAILRRTGSNPAVQIATVPAGVTQYVDTTVSPGTTYDYQVVSYNVAGRSQPAGVIATTSLVGVSTLPPPWVDSDVGTPSISGVGNYNNGMFTVNTRSKDASGTADQFNFIHQTITGDAVIVARLASLGNTDFWAKAGLMVRSSIDPASTYAYASISPGGGSRFQWRSTTGSTLSDQGGPVLAAPAWLKLIREGNTFFAYGSLDRVNWGLIGAAKLNMPATVEIGMAVTSYTTALFNTSKFDNVSVAKLDFSHGLAINAGGTDAGIFQADAYNTGGNIISTTATVSTTGVKRPAPEAVYQTALQGSGFTYTIPNLTPGGTYQVRLHFAELVYNAAGQRQFNVSINGQQVLTNFDIFQTAGGMNQANVQEFLTTADVNGVVTIAFSQGTAGNPLVNGVELAAKGLSVQAATLSPTVDNVFKGVVATFSSLDLQATAADFKATIDWGDGTTSDGTVVVNPGGGFQVLGTHTYSQVNVFTFQVSVTGSAGESKTATGVATVLDLPLDVTPADVNTSEGVSLANTVLATFVTADPLPASSYLVSIDWGDGSAFDLTSGVVTQSGGVYSVSGSHVYDEQGVREARITITVPAHNGVDAMLVPVVVPITVTETPLVISPGQALAATIGFPLTNVSLATFTDPAGADAPSYYHPTIDWGDGSTSAGTIVANGQQFTVLGSHVYQSLGNKVVVLSVRDQAGDLLGTINLTATVSQVPVTGGLTAASDSGVLNSDGITVVKTPTYQGTAPVGSVVTLTLQPSSSGSNAGAITATGQADASGHWIIAVPRALADGKYAATASTTTSSSSLGSICIDTAGAKILSVQLLRSAGQVKIQFQDSLGGLDPSTLLNPALYSVISAASGVGAPLTAADIQVIPGASPTAVQTVILKPLHGAALTASNYALTVFAAQLFDLAGNPLDGKFNGKLPSGGAGASGTDFAAIVSGSGAQTTVSAIGSSVARGISPIPKVPKVVVHPQVGLPNGRVTQGFGARALMMRAVPSATSVKKK